MRRLAFRAFAAVFGLVAGTPVARAIWKLPGTGRLFWWLMGRLRPNVAQVMGHQMHLDPTDSLQLSLSGVIEPLETRLFETVIRPGDVVVDIGAHIGYYTLLAARGVGPTGRVFSFEPEIANFALLQRNVAENGYANVACENKAVSDVSEVVRLFVSAQSTGDHRIAAPAPGRKEQIVEAVSLDDFFAGGEVAPNVIKMDIQGGELRALEGARRLLESNPDLLLFTELQPAALRDAGTGVEQFLASLKKAGFQLHEIDETEGNVTRSGIEELVLECGRFQQPDDHTDLICAKGAGAADRLAAAIELNRGKMPP